MTNRIPDLLKKYENIILDEWIQVQLSSIRNKNIKEAELKQESKEFLTLLTATTQKGSLTDISGSDWTPVRDFLGSLSKSRAKLGLSPSETAGFIFSLKPSIFKKMRDDLEPQAFADEVMKITVVLDKLGLYTTEVYQKAREEVISRQQQEMLELSTPVVQLWEGVLALPLIGTLDSARTQVVMENLLQRIVDTGSTIAVIDITGVPTVDTLVAQHLLKTIAAARLMGADCIISGIRPQIAQTIVHLGVDLGQVVTKASLADAFVIALQRLGQRVESGKK